MKTRALLLLIFLSLTTLSGAQNTTAAPHGGKLNSNGFYHIEVVECYEFLEVYLYDRDMQVIPNLGIRGDALFYFPDNTRVHCQLYPYGIDGFTAEIKHQCYASCEIGLQAPGFAFSLMFYDFGLNNEDCKRPEKFQTHN